MDLETIFVSFIGGSVCGFLSAYLSKKGQNLATKEDMSEITKKIEEVKMKFSGKSQTLIKKRETYEKICKGLQVFIQGRDATSLKKNEMLEAYSTAWLWASDAVLDKLNRQIVLQVARTQNPTSSNQVELKKSFTECILEMRKDSGYEATNQKAENFQFVSFQN